jgi:hypothetical protein
VAFGTHCTIVPGKKCKHRQRNSRDRFEVLRRLTEYHTEWDQHPLLERIDAGFPDMVIADYDGALKEAERDVFGPDELPTDIHESLNTTLRLFLSHATQKESFESRIWPKSIGPRIHARTNVCESS